MSGNRSRNLFIPIFVFVSDVRGDMSNDKMLQTWVALKLVKEGV